MAGNGRKNLDRRSLIGLAAAAAASGAVRAAPQPAGPTQVVVDLGDLRLPDAIARTMELQIRRAVLMAVAQALPRTRFRSLPLPKGVRGIVLRPA